MSDRKKVEIIVAESAGFCFGVKRAMNMAFEAAQKHGEVVSYGPLIHNPQAIEKLSDSGVHVKNEIDEMDPKDVVIIRSHGVPCDLLEELQRRHEVVIDATCPIVRLAQDDARKLAEEGYDVILLGQADHPEVKSILAEAGGKIHVVDNPEVWPSDMPVKVPKVGLLSQTTQPIWGLAKLAETAVIHAHEVRIFNTVCNSTVRQKKESLDLAKAVDVLVVVGGFNSANTTKLYKLCRESNPRTYQVEVADQLESVWFSEANLIGVTTGASTPDWILKDVVDRLQTLTGAALIRVGIEPKEN